MRCASVFGSNVAGTGSLHRACQLKWHPLYIRGTGKSEGEGCEHVFSATNDLARTVWYASRFHRRQAIEEYFTFWDEEKYALLSKFISNHYREAAEDIRLLEKELAEACSRFEINTDDFVQHIDEERAYLEGLKKPPPEVETKGCYVEALNELYNCRQEWENACANVNRTLERVAPVNALAAVAQARKHVETTYTKLQNTETLVGTLEQILNISERWSTESSDYKKYHQENIKTKYQAAIDNLERLVIMRLFELTKLCSSGTGTVLFLLWSSICIQLDYH
ncbi:hypothetical protein F5887DRAFT_892937 [Amanita rubescens]|nr:hypothetical protein F5887DRAFT_892937 [Amanita rubescens]